MRKILSALLLAGVVMTSGCGLFDRIQFDKAHKSSLSNLKQIGAAIAAFSLDNDGRLPQSLSELSGIDRSVAIAAFDQSSDAVSKTEGYFSYAYVIPPMTGIDSNSGEKDIFIITDASATPVAFEKPWTLPEYAETIAVLYADGHVDEIPISSVSTRSCEEVLQELLEGKNIDPLFKTAMLERAKTEDERR